MPCAAEGSAEVAIITDTSVTFMHVSTDEDIAVKKALLPCGKFWRLKAATDCSGEGKPTVTRTQLGL